MQVTFDVFSQRRKKLIKERGLSIDLFKPSSKQETSRLLLEKTQPPKFSIKGRNQVRATFIAYSVVESQTNHTADYDNADGLSTSEAESSKTASENVVLAQRSLYKDFLQPFGQQVSIGTLLGIATGYSLKRIGRFVLFLIGTEVVILQLMAYKEWVTVHWNKIGRDLAPNLNKSFAENFMDILLHKLPFSCAFCGGLKFAP
eukprot:jgi/Galph1/3631/GphlegSOOS_G2279.1